jgi:hypothetical protein
MPPPRRWLARTETYTKLSEMVLTRQLSGNQKLVLLALVNLAAYRRPGTFLTEVSVARLARLVGLHRVTVQHIMSGFKADGILERRAKDTYYIQSGALSNIPALDLPPPDVLWFAQRRADLENCMLLDRIADWGPRPDR